MMELIGQILVPVLFFYLGYEFHEIINRKRRRSPLANDAAAIAKGRRIKSWKDTY